MLTYTKENFSKILAFFVFIFAIFCVSKGYAQEINQSLPYSYHSTFQHKNVIKHTNGKKRFYHFKSLKHNQHFFNKKHKIKKTRNRVTNKGVKSFYYVYFFNSPERVFKKSKPILVDLQSLPITFKEKSYLNSLGYDISRNKFYVDKFDKTNFSQQYVVFPNSNLSFNDEPVGHLLKITW